MPISVRMNEISRRFGERSALTETSASALPGKVLLITGPNGSGKSTMLKIAAGLLRPSTGSVIYSDGGTEGLPYLFRNSIGLVSPELELYDELTAEENLIFFAKIKGITDFQTKAEALLGRMALLDRADDPLSSFSSGMKQRMKYCFALIGEPEVLLLDEPTANLDGAGKDMAYAVIDDFRKSRTVIIATNEKEEVSLGDEIVLLGG